MKRNTNHKLNGRRINSNGHYSIRIEFSDPSASVVNIAGTFNDWHPDATPMVAMGQGRWLKELVLPPGKYEYLFVVNGQWMADRFAEASVPNPFGGANSVLNVPRLRSSNVKEKSSR